MPDFTFDASIHVYALDGLVLPSVTQILNEWYRIDFGRFAVYYNPRLNLKIDADIWEQGQDRGTAVHDMLYLCLSGQGVNRDMLDPELLPYLEKIEWFMDRFKPKVLLVEHKGYHKKLFYAGRLDAMIESKRLKHPTLFDAKSGMIDHVGPQTSAYEPLAREELAYKGLIDRYCLDLKPDKYTFEPCGTAQDWRYFQYRLWAHKYERRIA